MVKNVLGSHYNRSTGKGDTGSGRKGSVKENPVTDGRMIEDKMMTVEGMLGIGTGRTAEETIEIGITTARVTPDEATGDAIRDTEHTCKIVYIYKCLRRLHFAPLFSSHLSSRSLDFFGEVTIFSGVSVIYL